jgi:hypothetical protein
VYVLQGPLQQGQKIRKWEDRACIGFYLGPSPQHAKLAPLFSAYLLEIYHHVQFDDLFETATEQVPDGPRTEQLIIQQFEAPLQVEQGQQPEQGFQHSMQNR